MNTYIDLHIGQRAMYYTAKHAQGREVVVVDIVYPNDQRSPETWTAYANASFAETESLRTRPLGVRRFVLIDEKFSHIIVPDTFQMKTFLKPKQEEPTKAHTNMNFELALALTARNYRVRCVYWPVEDYLRRSHKSEPGHPTIVRFRGRMSDSTPLEFIPFLTEKEMASGWCIVGREGDEDVV